MKKMTGPLGKNTRNESNTQYLTSNRSLILRKKHMDTKSHDTNDVYSQISQ